MILFFWDTLVDLIDRGYALLKHPTARGSDGLFTLQDETLAARKRIDFSYASTRERIIVRYTDPETAPKERIRAPIPVESPKLEPEHVPVIRQPCTEKLVEAPAEKPSPRQAQIHKQPSLVKFQEVECSSKQLSSLTTRVQGLMTKLQDFDITTSEEYGSGLRQFTSESANIVDLTYKIFSREARPYTAQVQTKRIVLLKNLIPFLSQLAKKTHNNFKIRFLFLKAFQILDRSDLTRLSHADTSRILECFKDILSLFGIFTHNIKESQHSIILCKLEDSERLEFISENLIVKKHDPSPHSLDVYMHETLEDHLGKSGIGGEWVWMMFRNIAWAKRCRMLSVFSFYVKFHDYHDIDFIIQKAKFNIKSSPENDIILLYPPGNKKPINIYELSRLGLYNKIENIHLLKEADCLNVLDYCESHNIKTLSINLANIKNKEHLNRMINLSQQGCIITIQTKNTILLTDKKIEYIKKIKPYGIRFVYTSDYRRFLGVSLFYKHFAENICKKLKDLHDEIKFESLSIRGAKLSEMMTSNLASFSLAKLELEYHPARTPWGETVDELYSMLAQGPTPLGASMVLFKHDAIEIPETNATHAFLNNNFKSLNLRFTSSLESFWNTFMAAASKDAAGSVLERLSFLRVKAGTWTIEDATQMALLSLEKLDLTFSSLPANFFATLFSHSSRVSKTLKHLNINFFNRKKILLNEEDITALRRIRKLGCYIKIFNINDDLIGGLEIFFSKKEDACIPAN